MFVLRCVAFVAAVWRVAGGQSSTPYISNGGCLNSTSEYYLRDLQLCCSKCKPGTRLESKCTSDRDTVCSPCPAGQQSEKMNHFSNCFSCQKCSDNKGLMYSRNCSADTNAVCKCKPGMFCSLQSSNSGCDRCKKYKICKAGEGVFQNGTSTADVRCAPCPDGTFSNQSNTEPCKPHTRCEGRSVLVPGSSTADTQCAAPPASTVPPQMTPSEILKTLRQTPPRAMEEPRTLTPSLPPLYNVMSSTACIQISDVPKPSSEPDPFTVLYSIGVVMFVLTAAVMVTTCWLRKRKGVVIAGAEDKNKAEQNPAVSVTAEHQCLLPGDTGHKEPSMTSSDSQSQPDSCHTHSSSDWLERTSQEESPPEQPSISSPVVNLSITATFNCQLNPTTASCSIPLNHPAPAPQTGAAVRLSQEEVCTSCQQEDGKEALRSVQESGVF